MFALMEKNLISSKKNTHASESNYLTQSCWNVSTFFHMTIELRMCFQQSSHSKYWKVSFLMKRNHHVLTCIFFMITLVGHCGYHVTIACIIAWSKICFWLVKFQCHYTEGFKEHGSMKLSIPIG